MALTAAVKHTCKTIIGIPDQNTTLEISGLYQKSRDPNTSGFTAMWVTGDISGIQTQVDTILNAVNAQQETVINALVVEWDCITSYNPLTVNKGENSAEGTLVNYPKERENIRFRLMNELGIAMPQGGFMGEYNMYGSGRVYSGDR